MYEFTVHPQILDLFIQQLEQAELKFMLAHLQKAI